MDRIGKHINLSQLLWKHLNEDLSSIELQEKEILFEKNPKLQKWFDEFRTQKHIEKRLDEHYSIDLENKWKEFCEKTTTENSFKKISKLMLRVAAVILPVAVAVYLLFQFGWNTTGDLAKNYIVPDGSKTTLTLSTGKVVQLEAKIADTIYDIGMEIKFTGTKLIYAKSNRPPIEKIYKTNVLNVPHGGEFQLTFPDGTKIWVNSESKLTYLVLFGEKNRDIELEGEAYFEVVHNHDLPFRVRTKNGSVKVLGTSFNVRAYTNEKNNVITLAEGKVELKMGEWDGIYLEPGDQAIYTMSTEDLTLSQVDVSRFLAWKNGQFMFVDNRLEDILNDLARWYDIEVFYETESVKEMLFTCYVSKDKGISEILELLQKTRLVKFEMNDNYVLIKKILR